MPDPPGKTAALFAGRRRVDDRLEQIDHAHDHQPDQNDARPQAGSHLAGREALELRRSNIVAAVKEKADETQQDHRDQRVSV